MGGARAPMPRMQTLPEVGRPPKAAPGGDLAAGQQLSDAHGQARIIRPYTSQHTSTSGHRARTRQLRAPTPIMYPARVLHDSLMSTMSALSYHRTRWTTVNPDSNSSALLSAPIHLVEPGRFLHHQHVHFQDTYQYTRGYDTVYLGPRSPIQATPADTRALYAERVLPARAAELAQHAFHLRRLHVEHHLALPVRPPRRRGAVLDDDRP